jgi:3-oxoacyl-[acyl-carrier-protein] synthase II
MKRVVITGLGAVTPLGKDVESFFEALVAGHSGVREIEAAWGAYLAAPVMEDIEGHFPKLKRATLDRVAQLSLVAARQAITQAGIDFSGEASEQTGIYWGTGVGGIGTLEIAYDDLFAKCASRLRPTTIVMAMNNASAGQIGIEFGVRGPSFTYSSACSSSAVAIGEAFHAIRSGRVKAAIAGGGEAPLTQGSVKAWESLQTLARKDAERPETSCRPFSADRSGFVLGEGAAALVLEEEASARARGAKIIAEIVGYGNTTDASHITQPDSSGQARAMLQALAEAGLSPQQVDHINAHGTGTKAGDLKETSAIKQVFGEYACRIPVSATKALHGHLMGATGAVEMLAVLVAMRTSIVPPTAHLFHPDLECDLDYVSEGARKLDRIDAVMSNSFGFGGNNVVLLVKRYKTYGPD